MLLVRRSSLFLTVAALLQQQRCAVAFVPCIGSSSSSAVRLITTTPLLPSSSNSRNSASTRLFYADSHDTTATTTMFTTDSSSSTDTEELPPIDSMCGWKMMQELQSYGINTKDLTDDFQLKEALIQCRAEGFVPIQGKGATSNSDPRAVKGSNKPTQQWSYAQRGMIWEEMTECEKMRASELKRELEERGVNTKIFLEKKEIVQAVAEIRAEEGYTVYKDVELITDDVTGPRPAYKETEEPQPSPDEQFYQDERTYHHSNHHQVHVDSRPFEYAQSAEHAAGAQYYNSRGTSDDMFGERREEWWKTVDWGPQWAKPYGAP